MDSRRSLRERTSRRNLRLLVTEQIRLAIFNGQFEPGQILSDTDLAHWLDASRQPIRDALYELERIGLVEIFPQRFTRVVTAEPDENGELRSALIGLVMGALSAGRTLTPQGQDALATHINELVERDNEALAAKHPETTWQLVRLLLAASSNPTYQSAVSDIANSLAYRVSIAPQSSPFCATRFRRSLYRLRDATLTGDHLGIQRALENMLHIRPHKAPNAHKLDQARSHI